MKIGTGKTIHFYGYKWHYIYTCILQLCEILKILVKSSYAWNITFAFCICLFISFLIDISWCATGGELMLCQSNRSMLCSTLLHHSYCFYRSSPSTDESSMLFEAVGGQQVPPGDLIRELEELSLTKLPSPAPSDTNSWGSAATGTSTPDDSLLIVGPHSPPPADHGEYCDM